MSGLLINIVFCVGESVFVLVIVLEKLAQHRIQWNCHQFDGAEIQLLNLGRVTVINCDKILQYFFRRNLIFVQFDLTFERPKWISVLSDFVCFVVFSNKPTKKITLIYQKKNIWHFGPNSIQGKLIIADWELVIRKAR